jgi:hypothetical protein
LNKIDFKAETFDAAAQQVVVVELRRFRSERRRRISRRRFSRQRRRRQGRQLRGRRYFNRQNDRPTSTATGKRHHRDRRRKSETDASQNVRSVVRHYLRRSFFEFVRQNCRTFRTVESKFDPFLRRIHRPGKVIFKVDDIAVK